MQLSSIIIWIITNESYWFGTIVMLFTFDIVYSRICVAACLCYESYVTIGSLLVLNVCITFVMVDEFFFSLRIDVSEHFLCQTVKVPTI